jgi:hypothetical protein
MHKLEFYLEPTQNLRDAPWNISKRMFEKDRKVLHCDVIPSVIRNHGLPVRNPLKRVKRLSDRGSSPFSGLRPVSP